MFKISRSTILLVLLSVTGVNHLFAQETFTCDGNTVTDGVRIELTTPASSDFDVSLEVLGLDEDYHGISFEPMVSTNGNCLEVIYDPEPELEIILPGDLTFPGSDDENYSAFTTLPSGQTINIQIGNRLSPEDPDTGHNFALLVPMLFLNGESSQLTIHYGPHISYAEVYMLSAPDLTLLQGLSPINTQINVTGDLTDSPYVYLCNDVSSCETLFEEDRNVYFSIPTSQITLAETDSIVHLERMDLPEFAGAQTLELSGSEDGFYILTVHIHCVNTCGNP